MDLNLPSSQRGRGVAVFCGTPLVVVDHGATRVPDLDSEAVHPATAWLVAIYVAFWRRPPGVV
jgi:hypothetical protein